MDTCYVVHAYDEQYGVHFPYAIFKSRAGAEAYIERAIKEDVEDGLRTAEQARERLHIEPWNLRD